jgi:hypothetical protein
MNRYAIFLGGRDLEMETIREAVLCNGQASLHDKRLGWDNSKASAYEEEIGTAVRSGFTPVTVELEPDTELPDGTILIDHHGKRSGEPASLLQVLELLNIEPTREHQLIAANDSGYIPAMQKMGATQTEIDNIRAADRKAQGVTRQMENEAVVAVESARKDDSGVLIVRYDHLMVSPVTDRLFATWPNGKENLLVISSVPTTIHEVGTKKWVVSYFGHGHICKEMVETFKTKKSWGGGKGFGDPEKNAFAGCEVDDPSHVVEFVTSRQPVHSH